MKSLYIESVGVCAPGLLNWQQAIPVLRGEQAYEASDPGVYQPQLLPPNERRRATAAVRLAFRVAEDAMNGTTLQPHELASVFTSSEGDTGILHRLCSALAEPQRAISPTDFHNSVHNAAAGYWSIAAQAKRPSASLSAFDASFCAGLLEAACLALDEKMPVLLAAYDIRPPEPLYTTRPLTESIGVALVLSAQPSLQALARIEMQSSKQSSVVMANVALESLRLSNPAGRALPLLHLLANRKAGTIVVEGTGDQRWQLALSPL